MSAQEVAQSVPDTFRDDGPARSEDGRLMYYEHQVQYGEGYDGPFRDTPIERLRISLEEAISATDLCCASEYPLPCAGLPGRLHNKYDRESPEAALIELGIRYVGATVRNERRTMHNLWEEARQMIYALEKKAEDLVFQRMAERRAEEDLARVKKEEVQLVYFIAAASGPIKIGIAVNPRNRLGGLQTGHHEKLELLATCPGGQAQERAYHEQFASRRLNGEWFERCPEIEAEIARLQEPGV